MTPAADVLAVVEIVCGRSGELGRLLSHRERGGVRG